jgi:ATP-dependent DNA helicase RecQ
LSTLALDILKKNFGHTSFRPQQEAIIDAVLQGKDTLALLPTGGGKSVCYQIPSLHLDGICLVISPLIALINDQVAQLKSKNIKAIGITGGLSHRDLDEILDNCIYGNYKFLYLSPERLQQDLVRERIEKMKINLVAIDEAHCISEWGHDFRPAYREINALRSLVGDAPFIAVTATATTQVQQDIIDNLELEDPQIFKSSYRRDHLFYDLENTSDKREALIKFYKNNPGSSIAYVRSRKNTIEFAKLLSYESVKASSYHGGLSNKMRDAAVKSWTSNEIAVMVATNAFGMGIDKADVRSVVHLQLPDSIESYYQETGRAGRDGNQGIAKFIYNQNDVLHARNQFIDALPTTASLKKIYRHLSNYFNIAYGEGVDRKFDLPFADFCRQYHLNATITYSALQALDRFSVISLDQNFNNRCTVSFRESGTSINHFTSNRQEENAVVQSILRTYGSSRSQVIQVNPKLIAVRSNTSEKKVLSTLKELHEQKMITARITTTDTTVTYLQPREDDRTINAFAREIEQYNAIKKDKLNSMIDLLSRDLCMEKQLLRYFGEDLNDNCGHCSYCNKGQIKDEFNVDSILSLLRERDYSVSEMVRTLNRDKKEILQLLRELTESELIINIAPQRFRIKNG